MTKKTRIYDKTPWFLAGSAAMIGVPALAQNYNSDETTEIERDVTETVRRNISSFRRLDWRPYFSSLNGGAILVDIDSRALHIGRREGHTIFTLPVCP